MSFDYTYEYISPDTLMLPTIYPDEQQKTISEKDSWQSISQHLTLFSNSVYTATTRRMESQCIIPLALFYTAQALIISFRSTISTSSVYYSVLEIKTH